MATQKERFARCVKDLTKKIKLRKPNKAGVTKEGAAIGICTRSILWPQGRTIKRFYMKNKKPVLITQKRSNTSKK